MRWGDQKQLYQIKSASKSIGATMLGIAVKDGLIDLDAPARRYHPTLGVPPESNTDTGWLDEITILHLATQTAGFEKPGGYEPLVFRPGTYWHYSDGGPNWLAECITLAYRRDVAEIMFERVFGPLGISRTDLEWPANSYRPHEIDGIPRREFGSSIGANVEALSRIGYLYLREGRWEEEQILPPKFVQMASRPVDSVSGQPAWDPTTYGESSAHYSLLWWNNADGGMEQVPRDAFWAWGLWDNLIVVIPSQDLVIARCGERGRKWPRDAADPHRDYRALKPFIEPIAAAAPDAVVDGHARTDRQGG
jgi:CubicO group peptidase (beta-lactamase class C family)